MPIGTPPNAVTALGQLLPRSAFGELVIVEPNPRVQIDAVYGLEQNVETFTATGGTVSASDGNFVCATGTSAGGYGVIRSRRLARYRPGQALDARFTALFDSANATANSLQAAGPFSVNSGFFVGYNGTSFGVMHRTGGQMETRTLTVTVGAGGAETFTITLSGTAYNVSLTAGDVQHAAWEIADYFDTNVTAWNVTSNDDTVVFQYAGVGEYNDTYSVSSTGTADGSFVRDIAGVANTETWVAQASWNLDTLDGTTASGFNLDPSKGNLYRFEIPYLGYGSVLFSVRCSVTENWIKCHQFQFPNTRTTPTLSNPSLFIGWIAASLGSTTNMTVKGGSGAVSVMGPLVNFDRPRATSATNTSVDTAFECLLSLRNRISYAGTHNLKETHPTLVSVSNESSKTADVRILLNPTFDTSTDEPNWTYHDETSSTVEVDTTARALSSQGEVITGFTVEGGGSVTLNFKDLGLHDPAPFHLEPEDVLSVVAKVTSGAASSMTCSITWVED